MLSNDIFGHWTDRPVKLLRVGPDLRVDKNWEVVKKRSNSLT